MYKAPMALPSPEFRTTVDFPFSYTGVDFAGPLCVREGDDTRKVCIALFTCAVSRAIHLDLVSDLAADTFLRCFKRFTARFDIPVRLSQTMVQLSSQQQKLFQYCLSSRKLQTICSATGSSGLSTWSELRGGVVSLKGWCAALRGA